MKVLKLVTPITRSMVGVFRPFTSRVVPMDGEPIEMAEPHLAAALVPQVYRPRSRNLMRSARIGQTTYTTSLSPKDGCYIVPAMDVVRNAESLEVGDVMTVHLTNAEQCPAEGGQSPLWVSLRGPLSSEDAPCG